MKELFGCAPIKTNEEFKKVIKRRMNFMLLIGLLGAATLTGAFLAEFVWKVSFQDYMLGVYCGLGTGLLVASVILWIKYLLILGNEEKLKESRLACTDERIQEISRKAFRAGAIIMLAAMYGVGLIGGFFYPVLVKVLMFLICVFLLTYIIVYQYFNKRM